MALSDDDKYRVIFALCHNGKILIPTSTHYNSIVADRLENLNTQIETQVLSLLTSIESLKTALTTGYGKDNVKRIGDIELDTTMSRSSKTKELSRLLDELSKLLDIPNRCRVGSTGVGCLVL